MGYNIHGVDYQADDQGYLLEPVFDDEVVRVVQSIERTHAREASESS